MCFCDGVFIVPAADSIRNKLINISEISHFAGKVKSHLDGSGGGDDDGMQKAECQRLFQFRRALFTFFQEGLALDLFTVQWIGRSFGYARKI